MIECIVGMLDELQVAVCGGEPGVVDRQTGDCVDVIEDFWDPQQL